MLKVSAVMLQNYHFHYCSSYSYLSIKFNFIINLNLNFTVLIYDKCICVCQLVWKFLMFWYISRPSIKIDICLFYSVQNMYWHFWQVWKQISLGKDFISWEDSAQMKDRETGGIASKITVFDYSKNLVLFCLFHDLGFFLLLLFLV